MSKLVFTSDLHLTDRPEDEYRWEIFDILREQKADHVFIVGDLTDKKDRHSSALVNRIVDEMDEFVIGPTITMGNHDYVDPHTPFFRFLGMATVPHKVLVMDKRIFNIPHTRDRDAFKKLARSLSPDDYDLVLCHQLFKSSNMGQIFAEEGCDPMWFHRDLTVIAGDVHVPQTLEERVHYCGAPYPVAFGDTYQPRILVLENDTLGEVQIETIRKEMLDIREPGDILKYNLSEQDQVKIRMHLKPAELGSWDSHRAEVRKICESLGVLLCGLELKKSGGKGLPTELLDVPATSPISVFEKFCESKEVDSELRAAGKSLIS